MNTQVRTAHPGSNDNGHPTSRLRADLPLYLGFAATGVGVALPGVLLPVMLVRWHLRDAQAGRLFLMAWIGSSLGALLVRGSLRRCLLFGTGAIACGAVALSFSGAAGADACMALYGMGLGLTMTSISLLCERHAIDKGTELIRLNLLWAIGACSCPSLSLHAQQINDIRPMLFGLGAFFAALFLWSLFQRARDSVTTRPLFFKPWEMLRSVPAGLIVMIMLITGIEASAGGWLATYAQRQGHHVAEMIAAPTCFWAGLLLSRLLWSLRTAWVSHANVVRGSIALMAAAALLLVTSHGGPVLLAAAFAMGFGIGPTYPLLLAWSLGFQRSGSIFFLAGIGSACLPWLTGVSSSARHSLRIGLLVPTVATAVMLALALSQPLGGWSRQERSRG